jgi:hypothetical protein
VGLEARGGAHLERGALRDLGRDGVLVNLAHLHVLREAISMQ